MKKTTGDKVGGASDPNGVRPAPNLEAQSPLAWRDGLLVFVGEPLDDLDTAVELQREARLRKLRGHNRRSG